MRLELTLPGLLVKLANHYTTRGAQGQGTYLSFRFLSVLPCGQLKRQSPQFSSFSFSFFFLFCWLSLGLCVWPRLGDPFVSQNPREVYVSFPTIDSEMCIYHLFIWSNFNFLYTSQRITFPTQSCLVLYSFCTNLPHSQFLS